MNKRRFFMIHGMFLGLFFLAAFFAPRMKEYRSFLIGFAEIILFFWLLLLLSFLSDCFLREKGKGFARFGELWKSVTKDLPKPEGEKLPFGKRIGMLIVPVFGIVYMVFFFGVFELYFANTNEWLFSWRSILPIAFCALLLLATVIAVVLALFLTHTGMAERGVMLITSLFLAMYLQNLLLNGSGFIGGARTEYSVLGILINLIFWGGICFGLSFLCRIRFFGRKRVRICVGLCAAVLIMQLVPLPMFFLTDRDEGTDVTELGLIGEEQFTVSDDKNVMVFVMDAYWNSFFEDYLTLHKTAYRQLADFTYYNNVNSRALHTAFSLPYFMTASDVDFGVPLKESNRRAWQGENAERFYSTVQDMGYQVYLYTDSADYAGGAENMEGKIANIDEISYQSHTDAMPTYLAMLKLSVYRYMPYFMKDFFFVFDSSLVNRYTRLSYNGIYKAKNDSWDQATAEASYFGIDMFNHDYYNDLLRGLRKDGSGGRIIFQHIYGMHPPQFALDGVTETDFHEEEEICMDILYRYMDELKRLGVYDKTCIIVTADHGYTAINDSDPIMLIKGYDEHGDGLLINTAPGCLQTDLLPTILDLIGGEPEIIEGGVSLLQLSETEERERMIREFAFDPATFPIAQKCDTDGAATFNCYKEYHYTGRTEDLDPDRDLVYYEPIYDYWW